MNKRRNFISNCSTVNIKNQFPWRLMKYYHNCITNNLHNKCFNKKLNRLEVFSGQKIGSNTY